MGREKETGETERGKEETKEGRKGGGGKKIEKEEKKRAGGRGQQIAPKVISNSWHR